MCFSPFNKFIREKTTLGLGLIFKNQEKTLVIIFRIVIKVNESKGKYSFVKNIIFESVPHNQLILI